MRRHTVLAVALLLPAPLVAQASAPAVSPDGVVLQFMRFADIFGGRLMSAFESIPESRFGYRPVPSQQTIGYIAQHLEDANYGLCERLGGPRAPRAAKDSVADTVKALWPKDTLLERLRASLEYCDGAVARVTRIESPAVASTLLAFETDLAEHYAQLSVYMRLLGLVPPSAVPPKQRTAIELPAAALEPFIGVYRLATGLEFEVTMRGETLYVRSNAGGDAVRLWPETATDFFVREADAQLTFDRDASGKTAGFILHQYGRHRPATRIR